MPFSLQAKEEARTELQLPESQPGEERDGREARLGLVASDVATLKGKSFAACTPEELVALRRIMRTVRLTPPRRRSRRTTGGARRTLARPAAYGPRLDAHPRRPDRALVAQASHPAASPRADPRRVGLDDRLLPQPAPVRVLRPAGGHAGGGVLLRDPTHAHHPRAGAPPARRGAVAGRRGRRGLGRRHPHRGVAGGVRARLGPSGDEPRRHRGDLLRRPRPRRPGGARQGARTTRPPVPPDRLAQPAHDRRRPGSGPARWA